MRFVSLFSGVEAASVAWLPLGWEAMAFCEIEPFPCAVLEERFPEVPNLGDVSKVDWRSWVESNGRPDVLVGGSPCQSFSVAGSRTGLKGASGLMWEYVRAVREILPRWVVWENVPGALSSTGGEDFRCLLASLDELGYGLAWRVLDAQFFGVAQRRRRVFVVGSLGDRRCADVLFEPESMSWDIGSSRAKREELARSARVGPGGCFALQSDGGTSLNSNGSGWQGDGSSYTLNATDRQSVAVLPFDTTQITSPGNSDRPRWSDPNSALCASKHPPSIAFKFSAGAKAGSASVGEDVSPTLAADWHSPAVCMSDATSNAAIDLDMSGTITAHAGKQQPMVSDGCAVRRLTPRECERLQGFPDDWTLIPYRGKPADECPDGPRYKAMGNSMAVPVMRWIGRRIGEADAR